MIKHVRLALLATTLAIGTFTVSGCVTDIPFGTDIDQPVAPGQSVTLDFGQTAVLPDRTRVTYLSKADDSRCRPNVQCVWAGNAKIKFRHVSPTGATQDFTLVYAEQREHTVGRYRMQVTQLSFDNPAKVTLQFN